MPSEEQFFTKLGEIPVLNDGWSTALTYYTKVKDYNSLTKFALDFTESGVKKAAEISSPVIGHFQPQIDSVNNFACSKLDAIESKYPIVKQPTKEVRDACIEYVQPVTGQVKPVVTYVQSVVDNKKKQMENIKTYTTNLVTGARDLGVNTVSRAVTVTFDNAPGHLVTRTVDNVLTYAEGLVDKYIPEDQSEGTALEGGEKYGNCGPTSGPSGETTEPSPQKVAVHFRTVSNKLRQRMFRRAMKDFRNAKVHTMDTISKLHSTVDLIDYAKKNVETARGKFEDLWSQITSDQPAEKTDATAAVTVEQRIIQIGRILASQLRTGIVALEKASTEAGQFVRHPITRSKDFTDFIYQLSSNFKNTSIERIRASLQNVQTNLKDIIENVESHTWQPITNEMASSGPSEENLNSDEISDEDLETSGHESQS